MISSRHLPGNADLTYFTVTCHLAPIIADLSQDADYNPNTARIDAICTFTPKVRSGEVIHAHSALPPTGFLPMPVTAMIDDGYLKLRSKPDAGAAPLPGTLHGLKARLFADGNTAMADEVEPRALNYAPVRLLGNSAALELEPETPLGYDFSFTNIKIDGQPTNYVITGGYFEAPWADETIDLLDWMPLTPGPYAVPTVVGPQGPPGPPGDGALDFSLMEDKITPADPDQLVIGEGSARAYVTKKTSWANIKVTLKAFFDSFYESKANKGVANGYASLGADVRVPSSQLTISAVEYKGNWNAATNTPTLVDGVGNMGDMYRVTVAGTQLGITAGVGDVVFYNGSVWYKLGAADAATYQVTSQKGVANGYAALDSGGKVPVNQLPSTLMEYKGVWNAATNTPTLAAGTGDTGDVYRVSTAGTQFGISFVVGDYAIYNGTAWEKSDTTDSVVSVAGKTGVVTLVKADVGLPLADNTADAAKNVLSATKLTTARTINGVAFDGTVDVTIPVAPADAALYEKVANKGVANGYAALDATTRLPVAQLPLPAVEFKGNWNAATNTPTLVDGVGNMGDMYRVTTAGTQLGIVAGVGDVVFYDGSVWYKLGAADAATYQVKSEKGVNNGYASLDASGRIPASQLSVSALEYKGTWNAATNTPTLANGVGTPGDMWRVTVTGTQFGVKFTAGDFALYNGTKWETATSGTAGVSSVADLTGVVAAAPLKTNLELDQVDNTRDNVKNVLSATKLVPGSKINGVLFDGTADITVNQNINALPVKITPADADEFVFADSAAKYAVKKNKWSNLREAVGKWYDTAARTMSNKLIDFGVNTVTSTKAQLDAAVIDSDVTGGVNTAASTTPPSLTFYGGTSTVGSPNVVSVLSCNLLAKGASSTIMPSLHNEFAYALTRGCTLSLTKNGAPAVAGPDYTASRIANPFAPDARYLDLKLTSAASDVFAVELDFTPIPMGVSTNAMMYGIEFRPDRTPQDCVIEVFDNGAWVKLADFAENTNGVFVASSTLRNSTKVRFTGTNFSPQADARITSIFALQTLSTFSDSYLLPRAGGSMYGTASAPVALAATGGDANVGMKLTSKGTATVNTNDVFLVENNAVLRDLADEFKKDPRALEEELGVEPGTLEANTLESYDLRALTNYVAVGLAGGTPYVSGTGSSANVGLNLVSKGTGSVTVNGSVVGTRVAVPASATAAGRPGQWASDAGFIYTYTGNGTTHTWVRAAAAAW